MAARRHQHRGVAGDHAQTVPALDQAGLIGAPNHQVIERNQRRQMQVIAGLGKRTIGDFPAKTSGVANRGEEAIEHGLLRLIAHR